MKEFETVYRKLILVCVNEREGEEVACSQGNSPAIHARFKERVKEMGLSPAVRVSRTRCLGQCAKGPTVAIFPEDRWYGSVTLEDVEAILREHLKDLH